MKGRIHGYDTDGEEVEGIVRAEYLEYTPYTDLFAKTNIYSTECPSIHVGLGSVAHLASAVRHPCQLANGAR
jgi:hypothetical protein